MKCFSYASEEILGKSLQFLFFQDVAFDQKQVSDRFCGKMRHKSGQAFYADIYWREVCDSDGVKEGALVSVRDISEEKKNDEALQKSYKALRDLKYSLDQAAVVATTDPQGTILSVNDKFCEISKYTREELIGQDHKILRSGTHNLSFLKKMWETISRGKVWRGQFKNKDKKGQIFWFDTTIVPMMSETDQLTQYLSIHSDITKQKHYEEEVLRLSQYDHLTLLPNRSLFNDRLNQALKQNRRGKTPFAVMFIDLDRFKSVNDQLGHDIGDELLQVAAQRLTTCLRQSDTVARIGGDEFTVLLPTIAHKKDARLVAQKMVDVLKEGYDIQGHKLFITGSIGISLFPDEGTDAETLMKNADTAMYHVKEHEKGGFTFYDTLVNQEMKRSLDLNSALYLALDREEFYLLYQPLVDLQSRSIIGVEALIRWNYNDNGVILPETFISLAEKNGMILPIGKWVLETACRQLKAWGKMGHAHLSLSVNVSALQFKQSDFAKQVHGIIENTGITQQHLHLELTESLLMEHEERVISQLKKLKSYGVQLVIDDFGTGYSSLSYLKRFPIDALKIDQSFVKNLPSDTEDVAIAKMIITLADHLKLKVIAEGIETEEQLQFLKSQGCGIGQGFFLGRPLPHDTITQLLEQKDAKIVDHFNKG